MGDCVEFYWGGDSVESLTEQLASIVAEPNRDTGKAEQWMTSMVVTRLQLCTKTKNGWFDPSRCPT